jgi:hypothetical protein
MRRELYSLRLLCCWGKGAPCGNIYRRPGRGPLLCFLNLAGWLATGRGAVGAHGVARHQLRSWAAAARARSGGDALCYVGYVFWTAPDETTGPRAGRGRGGGCGD